MTARVHQKIIIFTLLFTWISIAAEVVNKSNGFWSSLRIHVVYTDELNLVLTDSQKLLLSDVLNTATKRLEQLLTAHHMGNPELTPLLISRSPKAYCAEWLDSKRCRQMMSSYTGEKCGGKRFRDSFRIPDVYLSELAVYHLSQPNDSIQVKNDTAMATDAVKTTLIPSGIGALNASYLMFVSALTEPPTLTDDDEEGEPESEAGEDEMEGLEDEEGIVSMASQHCASQPGVNRPIAGRLLLRPHDVSLGASLSGSFLQRLLAEFLRLLGFSRRLMSTYQRYNAINDTWMSLSRGELLDSGGRFVVSPAVRLFATSHFNCSRGLPLQSRRGLRRLRTSWDAGFMLSSVMAAEQVSPAASVLDSGTLALLEDSGWYRPNYAQADLMLWGHLAGCEFARYCHSTSSTEFCSPSSSASSPALVPDYFHRTVGACRQLTGSQCAAVLPTTPSVKAPTDGQQRHRRRSQCLGEWHSVLRQGRSGELRPACVKVDCSTMIRRRRRGSWPLASRFYQTSWRDRVNKTEVATNCPSLGGPDCHGRGVVCAPMRRVCPRRTSVQDLLIGGRLWRQILIESTESLNNIEDLLKAEYSEAELSSSSAKNFKIRFSTLNYNQLVSKDLIAEFKIVLQFALAEALSTDVDFIHILEVRAGSVIAIWQNRDPNVDADTKAQKIISRVSSGNFAIKLNGASHFATSVEEYTIYEDSSFPLTEVIVGGAVGGFLVLGLLLTVSLIAIKHRRPKPQVTPEPTPATSPGSIVPSNECDVDIAGVSLNIHDGDCNQTDGEQSGGIV